jgi:hypothetical protein
MAYARLYTKHSLTQGTAAQSKMSVEMATDCEWNRLAF